MLPFEIFIFSMANGVKDIRRRIKSVQNIRKITKAMELVSVSKMKRSTHLVQTSRPYARRAWGVLSDLAKHLDPASHSLLFSPSEIKRALIILIASDRGLCGSFNANLFAATFRLVANMPSSVTFKEFMAVGRKSQEFIMRQGWNLVSTYTHLSVSPLIHDIQPMALQATQGFLQGKYDVVYLVYANFISTIRQEATTHRLLPLLYSEELGSVDLGEKEQDRSLDHEGAFEFAFEPSQDEALDFIIPRLVEVQMYQAVLESIASEHAARMVAMKNATESASEMVFDLTLSYNQVRQAMITKEIAEISAGKAVLE